MFSLKGKRALVTGGSRGIGAAIARTLAEAGADVCIGYHKRTKDAKNVVAECKAKGVKAVAYASDIGTRVGAEKLVVHTVKELGGLDIFVGNAGIWPVEEVLAADMADDRWRRTMRENVDSMFFTTRAALKVMDPGGRVVLIASTAGQRGEAMHSDYGASKGAMISFVKSIAIEVARQGITVNAVAPGWVDTEMCDVPYADGGRDRIAAGIPVGRVATPEDIAFPTVFLCTDEARHITGEIVNVNGGSVLCG
ncbi:MAG TPA: SDR family oxidoreductase [Gemmatimonadaceae bacterium]|jgi:3-oxoacyl-[acyl-carrier protein] reductase